MVTLMLDGLAANYLHWRSSEAQSNALSLFERLHLAAIFYA